MNNNREITYMLHKLPLVMEKFEDELLQQKFQLTFSQFRILMAIGKNSVSQKSIADYWQITESAVSRQIDSLRQKDLIMCTQDEENRRKNSLQLTKNGRIKLQQAQNYIDEMYESVYGKLSKEELFQLSVQLGKIAGILCPGKGEDCEV